MRVWVTAIAIAWMGWASACTGGKKVASQQDIILKNPALVEQRADSLFFAAQRSKILGDYRTAITQYSDYLRLNKRNPTVYYELSRLFIEVRNPGYALAFAKRAVMLDSSNKWFQLALADAFGVNEQFDSAAIIYDRLSRLYPESEDYLFNKGLLLSKANKTDQALAVFNALEAKTGVVEELTYQKQRLLLKQSRVDDAAAEIRKLIALYPQELRYYHLLAEVYDANDRIADARQTYKTILSKDPNNPRALIAIANYAKKDGDTATYWGSLTRAFANPDYSIDDKVAFVYPYLQMLQMDTSKLQDGLELAGLLLKAHPNEAKAYALIADMYSQVDMLDSALVNYHKAITLDDTRFSVWYQLMWIYSRKDDPSALLRISDTVTRKFPKEFMGFYFLGVADYLLQRYPAAVAALNQSLVLGNGDKKFVADIYSLLGDAYHATGQHALSDSSYEHALILRPKDAVVLNNYSYYLSLRGEHLERAEEMSRLSLELEPESATYMDTYAWVLFRMGKYDQARIWIEKALSYPVAQQSPGILEHYGDILFNLKEVTKALEYWQKAKDKGASSVKLAKKIAEKRYIHATEPE
ncbi:tetratricopeptide repeat protein [Chitinophaga pendula]|uniref:tetratricopeptide repeat protein n=1 Tax=Chitinophaga TaxID=79328 RepID=UPI000BAEF3E2|nr:MULTISPECIES: tetratricopeptide repeat protein [Chitinophaga]ASZ10793.1 hypothetical protein CK934_07285 [Chitinophaga sp. MD30]UCJ06228.1 tetratricopeptide repeat protein [Chitinophaga pendula]